MLTALVHTLNFGMLCFHYNLVQSVSFFSLNYGLIRSVLLNLQVLWNFPDIFVTDFQYNSIVVGEHTLQQSALYCFISFPNMWYILVRVPCVDSLVEIFYYPYSFVCLNFSKNTEIELLWQI